MSRSGRPGGECMAGGACLGSDGFAPRGKLGDGSADRGDTNIPQFDVAATRLQGAEKETCRPDRQLAFPTVEGGIYTSFFYLLDSSRKHPARCRNLNF
eukprot:scaffold71079_cov63-Phaeocystis_antarctica.AAC.2